MGLIAGFFAYKMLKKNLEEHPYPFEITPDTGSIEYVSTAPEYRRHGIAASWIQHIIDDTPYENSALEVANTNETALRLYQRLGFAEFMRMKSPAPKASGVNEFVYMKKEKNPL